MPLKQRTSITAIAKSYEMNLRKQGDSYVTHCMFHTDETLSMVLNEQRGEFLCFGCGAKGNAVHLIQQLEDVDHETALTILERTDECLKPTMTHLT